MLHNMSAFSSDNGEHRLRDSIQESSSLNDCEVNSPGTFRDILGTAKLLGSTSFSGLKELLSPVSSIWMSLSNSIISDINSRVTSWTKFEVNNEEVLHTTN